MWNIKSKRLWWLLLIPVSLLVLITGRQSTGFVEVYRKYFPFSHLARLYSRAVGIIPFSVAELSVFAAGFAAVVLIIYFIVQLVVRKEKKKLILQSLVNIAVVGSVLFSVFVLFCGIYYYRAGIADYLGYEVKESSTEELYQVCMELAEQANTLSEEVSYNGDFSDIAAKTRNAYQNLGSRHAVFRGVYGKPKPVFLSKYMSYTEIVGIFIPFTMEANVNTDVVPYNIPSNACHEMAHMYGFMKEDEAGYIAYLACMASDEKEFQYSGTMHALISCKNALYGDDLELWAKVNDSLSERVKEDLRENSLYWEEIRRSDTGKAVAQAAEKVNDTYLKINGQKSGVKSYGKMVDLLLAQYRSEREKSENSALQQEGYSLR